MKLLHYVEIENFKRYGDIQRIELDHPAVLIGPNNCGKTSALQAIALWSIGLRTWRAGSKEATAPSGEGKAVNRLSILAVPVPKTRYLWHDLMAGTEMRITVAVDVAGEPVPVSMVFTHHDSDEIVYCSPSAETLAHAGAVETGAKLDVSMLYPMAGISTDEAVILPKRVEYLMGMGNTAEVLRNHCLQLHERSEADWGSVVQLMQRLFLARLSPPVINESGGVNLVYEQEGTAGAMDLSLSGRGFQQMLLLFTHLYLHKGGVILMDEPDAHLEMLRQRQVYVLLRDVAALNECQVVLVTHSEVMLSEALDHNLSLILDGKVDALASKANIRNALKHFGTEHYVRARETGHVLYVEGSTDVDMLAAFARKLNHPAARLLADESRLNVYYLQDNFPGSQRSADEELARVEGGYGMNAREHFNALSNMLPGLSGLAIFDHDGTPRKESRIGGLAELQWRRYEPENYFVSPELLERYATAKLGGERVSTNFGIMEQLMEELIFIENPEALNEYLRGDATMRRAFWRAQTQYLKLSTFAEEYFRRLGRETKTPMLLRKGELHQLIEWCEPSELNGDVEAKLNALMDLFK
jgi:ABC-type taurine transport system ATPase subunit